MASLWSGAGASQVSNTSGAMHWRAWLASLAPSFGAMMTWKRQNGHLLLARSRQIAMLELD